MSGLIALGTFVFSPLVGTYLGFIPYLCLSYTPENNDGFEMRPPLSKIVLQQPLKLNNALPPEDRRLRLMQHRKGDIIFPPGRIQDRRGDLGAEANCSTRGWFHERRIGL
jgi:hypothetical protein